MANWEDRIAKALKGKKKKGLTPRELAQKTSVGRKDRAVFRQTLDRLQEEGRLILHKGGFLLSENAGLSEAEIVKVTGTFGFARLADSDKEVFIPGRDLKGAMPGDRVLLRQQKGEGQLPDGRVYRVLEEAEQVFPGVLLREEGRWLVRPDRYVKFPLEVDPASVRDAKEGDKVTARVSQRGERHSRHQAELLGSFGSAQSAAACCGAVLSAAGIKEEFSPEALEQARAIASGTGIHPKEIEARTDLRELPIFTIDGADSKDLDDAVSMVLMADGGWELGVHIADVSYYVTHKSPLDRDALERGTSVYFADSVIPMLPPELSNGICSLNPGEDRLAFSVFARLDQDAQLTSWRLEKTVIRSRVKGVYGEVNAILDGTADDAVVDKYGELIPILGEMRELAKLLTRNRFARGGMDLDSVESKIVIGPDGRAVDVVPRERGVSERIIEEFMLIANQAAASYALKLELPFVFRIHESPAPDKVQQLYEVLDRLGVKHPPYKGKITAVQLGRVLESVRDSQLAPIVNTMVLRTMAKAKYSHQNIGHFGLGLEDYTHFTSPIRRYPDLTIHRVLSAQVTGMRRDNLQKRFEKFTPLSALQSTQREIAAMTAERDCEDCYKAEYMLGRIGEEMEGVISSATPFGVYVRLPNTVEGLVSQRSFPEGDWSFDGMLAHTDGISGRVLRLGEPVRIKVAAADVSAGQIDFLLAENAGE